MLSKQQIENLIQPLLQELSCFLVDIKISPQHDVFVEIDHRETGVTVKECVKVSRLLEKELTALDVLFSLEVSSPGIDQAFKVKEQYNKSIAKELEIVLKNGQKIIGVLSSVSDENIEIITKEKNSESKNKKELIDKNLSFSWEELKSVKRVVKI